MKNALTIVARIEAKKEKAEFVKSELIKLIEVTGKEHGCIQYHLHQDNDNPEIFLFFENWETRDLWQAHMKSTHLAEYKATTEDMLVETVINEMTIVE